MSRSDRDERDARKAARRARRLAERAEARAERKADQARRAHERAERLAEKAGRRGETRKRSIEDFVDDVVENYVDPATERWSRKAESWFENDQDNAGTRADREARRARREADEARREAEAAARSRRRSRSSGRHRRRRSLRSRFNSGRGLYRDKAHGKICGVCAGLADYLDVETWQVRLVAVLGLIFVPSMAVPTYFIAYFLMDDKPYYRRVTDQYDEEHPDDEVDDDMPEDDRYATSASRTQPPKHQMSNVETLHTAKEKFADLENRLRSMESHVTSSKFELQRELRKISGEDG